MAILKVQGTFVEARDAHARRGAVRGVAVGNGNFQVKAAYTMRK